MKATALALSVLFASLAGATSAQASFSCVASHLTKAKTHTTTYGSGVDEPSARQDLRVKCGLKNTLKVTCFNAKRQARCQNNDAPARKRSWIMQQYDKLIQQQSGHDYGN